MKKAGSIALSTCLLINAGSFSAFAEGTDPTEAGNEEYTQMISNMLEMIDMTKWQYNADDDVYYQSLVLTDNTYIVQMDEVRNGRKVYCVITDIHGNKATTDIAVLSALNG